MSLNVAFSIAQKGINSLEQQIAVISDNINNASTAGYTKKAFNAQSITANGYTFAAGGKAVQSVKDDALNSQLNTQSTSYQFSQTMSNYLSDYSDSFGGTSSSSTTVSTSLSNFTTATLALESDPTQPSNKTALIADAQQTAAMLNQLSISLQSQRQQANDAIGTTVSQINTDLQTITSLNRQIVVSGSNGQSTADLEDKRTAAINDLSQKMAVQYSFTSDNQMQVSAGGTQLIVGSQTNKLNYTAVGGVSASTIYPGGFPGITINGADITTSIKSGSLGALITLRDSTLPGEQAKLDSFASTLANTVNKVLSNGTAYPSLNTVSGTNVVTSATSLTGATGTFRVAVTDSTGLAVSSTDFTMSSYATVGAFVTALNAVTGVSAAIDSSGHLNITSTNAADGISLNQMSSSIGGIGATQYFGFNNLFASTTGSFTASNIFINPTLLTNSSALATSTLSSGTITTGTRALSEGDATVSTALVNAMNSSQSFAAAGNFSARSETLSYYAGSLIADAANQAASAKTSSDTAATTFNYLSSKLTSETGVNIDEESANLSQLQNYYSSTAAVLSTIKNLYTTLLEAYK